MCGGGFLSFITLSGWYATCTCVHIYRPMAYYTPLYIRVLDPLIMTNALYLLVYVLLTCTCMLWLSELEKLTPAQLMRPGIGRNQYKTGPVHWVMYTVNVNIYMKYTYTQHLNIYSNLWKSLTRTEGCKSLHVMCTHNRAGAHYWNPPYRYLQQNTIILISPIVFLYFPFLHLQST